MAREIMQRTASENKYLHRDFHVLLNLALNYVLERFGAEAARDYLREFAREYYAPLRHGVIERGLDAIREYFVSVYSAEEARDSVAFETDAGALTVRVKRCPAVDYILRSGAQPSPLYSETTDTVMRAVCEGTPVVFRMLDYREETGAATLRFTERRRDR